MKKEYLKKAPPMKYSANQRESIPSKEIEEQIKQFKNVVEAQSKFIEEKRKLLEQDKLLKAEQDELMAQIEKEISQSATQTTTLGDTIVRKKHHVYVLIYCNDTYDELRKIHPGMADLKWVKNDLSNARATVAMLDVPTENVYEFINSTRE